MDNLEYVLKFALQVIEDNELENTKNSDNWVIGEAIEEQLEQVKNCSIPDVSQQRELLESFREEWNKPRFDRDGIYESDIDDFLEDSNESNCY